MRLFRDSSSCSSPLLAVAESWLGRNKASVWRLRKSGRRKGSSMGFLTVSGSVWLLLGLWLLGLGMPVGGVEASTGGDADGDSTGDMRSSEGNRGSRLSSVSELSSEAGLGSDLGVDAGSDMGHNSKAGSTAVSAMNTPNASATPTTTVTVSVSGAGAGADAGANSKGSEPGLEHGDDASTTGTCLTKPDGYVAGLGSILLSLHGRDQCLVRTQRREKTKDNSLTSTPAAFSVSYFSSLSSDATVSPSQAVSPGATYDPDFSDSPLDAALFLSFEEWKKRNLEKAGQSPDHVGSSGRKGAGGVNSKKGREAASRAGSGRKGPENNIYNALDALGDDVEIEWGGSSVGDDGKVENGREPVLKYGQKGSGENGVVVDSQIGNNDASNFGDAGIGSTDTAFTAAVASNPQASASTRSSSSREAGKTCKERFNYASFDCGATVLKTNAEGKNPSAVLIEHKDSYMLNECGAKGTKFLIVELCADILVDTVVLANYEFFSSMIRVFRVSVSDRYPPLSQNVDKKSIDGTNDTSGNDDSVPGSRNQNGKQNVKKEKNPGSDNGNGKRISDGWRELGIFEARNSRGIQAFAIENPLVWARYLRVEFLSHYGSEFYCPVSLLRVHGTTMMEEFRYQQEENEGEGETNSEGNAEDIESNETEDQAGVEPDAVPDDRADAEERVADKLDGMPENRDPNKTEASNEENGLQKGVVEDVGSDSSSVILSSMTPSVGANSGYIQQEQQHSVSQIDEEGKLRSSDTLALATMYGNLTVDQLIGMVNGYFKDAERNEVNSIDRHADDACKASGTNKLGADADTGNNVAATVPVTPALTAINTASAEVKTNVSKDSRDTNIATNDVPGKTKANADVNADTDAAQGEQGRTATSKTKNGDAFTSILTPTASENAFNHESSVSQAIPLLNKSDTPSSFLSTSNSPFPSKPTVSSMIYMPSSSDLSRSSISSSSLFSSSISSPSSSSSSSPPSSAPAAIIPSPTTRPPPPSPTTQESFFKTVHKRLQMLESNSTLSLQYIEDQSRILRDAFLKVEKRQSTKIDDFLAKLSGNITEEVGRYRDHYDQLWQQMTLEQSTQKQQHQHEIAALSSRLSILADELVFQQRVTIAQSLLLVLCLGLLLFGSTGRGQLSVSSDGAMAASTLASTSTQIVDIPLLQQMLNRSQRVLRGGLSKSVQRSNAAEQNGKDADVRDGNGAEYVTTNRGSGKAGDEHKRFQHITREIGVASDRLNARHKEEERRESSSDLGCGVYTPASMSVTNTSMSPVRKDSSSENGRHQHEVDFYNDDNDDNDIGGVYSQGSKQNAQLHLPNRDEREDRFLSPPSPASPMIMQPSTVLLLDELRETQSGPPTPSGRRSIAH